MLYRIWDITRLKNNLIFVIVPVIVHVSFIILAKKGGDVKSLRGLASNDNIYFPKHLYR